MIGLPSRNPRYEPPAAAPEPMCASGYVRLNDCPGACPGGGYPYAYVCN
jgi:hypothetical protein